MKRAFLGLALRSYAVSLNAYPRRFRDELAAQMCETFSDRCRAAATLGTAAVAAVWARGIVDSLVNGLAERFGRGRTRTFHAALSRSPRRRFSMSLILDDVKRAARRLRRAPLFTASLVLSIAIGVGAFVSIYSVLDNVLWKAMPYKDPDRLVYIWRNYTWADFPRGWAGSAEVLALRDHGEAFEDVAVLRSGSVNLSARDGGEPQEIPITMTSANFFDVLGVPPATGRGFRPGEDVEGAALVVVLSHQLWQQRYGADADIVGRVIYIDDEPAEVIGVMPSTFHFAMHSSLGSPSSGDAYVNLRADLASAEGGWLAALARVREGVSPQVVQAELDAVAEPIDREIFNGLGLRLWPAYLHEDMVKDVRPALLAILAAAAFMLSILCVNLATLLLDRANHRSREMAVAAALGAGRTALLRDCLTESLMLTLSGGALGLAIASRGAAFIANVAVDLPRRYAVGIDGSVALVALVCAALLGVAAGAVPALRAARTDMAAALRRAGDRVTGGRAPGSLVVVQVAVSLMLLVGAGVLSRSFLYLIRSQPGFDASGVLTVRIPVTSGRYPEVRDLTNFFTTVRQGITGLPGVQAVGGVNALPLTRTTNQSAVGFPSSPANTGGDQDEVLVDWFTATPGYLESMGIPLLAGRGFRETDGADALPVAIIDDTLAEHFFPGEDAVGKQMTFFGESRTVIAVIDQPRLYNIHVDDRGQVFLPLAQRPRSSISLAIRGARDPAALSSEVRQLVRSIDPDQPLAEFRTMEQIADESLNGERLSLELIGGFAMGALLLATIGLYGVVSSSVTRRTREMGVRMALGANATRVRSLVVWQGMRLVLSGTLLGLAGSLATARFLESLLVGVAPTDPLTLAAAAIGLAAATLLACYIPARRASSVDPLMALRYE